MKSNGRISNFAIGVHSPDLYYLRGTFTLHIRPPRQVTTRSHIVLFFFKTMNHHQIISDNNMHTAMENFLYGIKYA